VKQLKTAARVQTILADYATIRPTLRTGDMVFTAHRSAFGRLIHVGQGFRRPWHAMIVARPGERVEVMESTAAEAGGKANRGVQRRYLSERINGTNGEVWISRLSEELRSWLDEEKMLRWMLRQEGQGYSYGQAVWAGLDGFIRILPENTWSKTYMCSRFGMAAIRNGFRDENFAGYYIAKEASPTPAQLSRMRGFYLDHAQVKGAKLYEIGGRV
jgi:hypothetical protein